MTPRDAKDRENLAAPADVGAALAELARRVQFDASSEAEAIVDAVRANIVWLPFERDNLYNEGYRLDRLLAKAGVALASGPVTALILDSPGPGDLSAWALPADQINAALSAVWRPGANDALLFQAETTWVVFVTHDGGVGAANGAPAPRSVLTDGALPAVPDADRRKGMGSELEQ